jgi:hypothetical protein
MGGPLPLSCVLHAARIAANPKRDSVARTRVHACVKIPTLCDMTRIVAPRATFLWLS